MTFWTEDGILVPALTAEQMREVDRIAVEIFGLGLLQMMENAGRNLAENVTDMLGHPGGKITIMAGSGGNGGGGLCCGRHLHNRGFEISLDVPSGLDATTGDSPGAMVRPERTVTLALPKKGLQNVAGDLYVADIGIPPEVYHRLGINADLRFGRHYWRRLVKERRDEQAERTG